MKTQTLANTLVAMLVLGCGSSQDASGTFDTGGPEGRGPVPGSDDAGPTIDSGGGGGGLAPMGPDLEPGGAGGGSGTPQSGILTAGMWDDNVNFAAFEDYRDGLWGDGTDQSQALQRLFSEGEQKAAETEAQADNTARTTLDVALVIDTTGSMGDEIAYLQSEFRDFAADINQRHPNAQTHWSLVVYRDVGDLYVVEHEDFTADATAFRGSLARQRAGGGGDYPEAPEQALVRANELEWRASDGTAKLVFWVADAPPHSQNLLSFADSVRTLRDNAVAIYPVASSGVDESTEYFMRATAQLTGGRYIFITNDSGVGLDHKEPSITCYYVTLLRDALLRAIDAELLREVALPEDDQIIRSVGQPDAAGLCQLETGTAQAF